MAQIKKHYSIEMFYGYNPGTGFVKYPLSKNIFSEDNLNSYLESIDIDSYKPVDLYDFTGEPRRAKVKLFLHNNETALDFFENIIISENYRLLDSTPSKLGEDGIYVIDPFVNIRDIGDNKVVFPAWYKDESPGYTKPPIIGKDQEITGSYLDYNDIYIKKNSKFLNLYIEVFYHEVGIVNSVNNMVFVGMIEATSLSISPTKTDVEFEAVDGLGILYDALEAYEEFCTFCQDETTDNGTGSGFVYEPVKTTGISMSDFILYALPQLLDYPYNTLFNLDAWINSDNIDFELSADMTFWATSLKAAINPIGSFSLLPDADTYSTYLWNDESYVYVLHIFTVAYNTENIIYYFGMGRRYAIEFSGPGGISINKNSLPIIYGTYHTGTSQYNTWFLNPTAAQPYAGEIFDGNPYPENASKLSYESASPTILQIRGAPFEAYVTTGGDYIRTVFLEAIDAIDIDLTLYNKCASFNVDMSPLDVLRLACLTTTQFIMADGYSIKFRTVNLINIDNPRWIGWSKIVKYSFKSFMEDNDLKKFDEIESVTLWEDIVTEAHIIILPGGIGWRITPVSTKTGKDLKPELKEKFRYLMETNSRISFEYKGNSIYWGEFITIVDHPRQKKYTGKIFFVYESEVKEDITKVSAFLVKSEDIRRR